RSDTQGKLSFAGIDEGTYRLVETHSPIGYNKLDEEVSVSIENSPSLEEGSAARFAAKVSLNGSQEHIAVENRTGALLPGTGGAGVYGIYAGGLIFLLAASVVIVIRRRLRVAELLDKPRI
ncbi:MAG: SpaA isopeptide-forming pilin-related protein, partial [Coriobacteriia bacterium]|nr:SpaA isopeptide-forming pilin-related protein [Coriobacteriia bacterium]